MTNPNAAVFRAYAPALGQEIPPDFREATGQEIDACCVAAYAAFEAYRAVASAARAAFLNRIADGVDASGETLIERAHLETGLPAERLRAERSRTVGQLRLFANLVAEGSWVDARIDPAQPDRKPTPRPDLRRMLMPIGPVAVFAASNFPLAFSAAGGDTASALAAGCPVIVKAHPSHPGTSEIVTEVIAGAVSASRMPTGTFALLHCLKDELSVALVRHPLLRGVAFTGSLRGGRALYDAAGARPEPIPVFAEMGSTNPVFLLPGALAQRAEELARGVHQSVTLGVGQFCTKPGIIIAVEDESFAAFLACLSGLVEQATPGTMLSRKVRDGYDAGLKRLTEVPGIGCAARSAKSADRTHTEAAAALLLTDGQSFLDRPELWDEVFGPSTLVVGVKSPVQLETIARRLTGTLTATLHAGAEDVALCDRLTAILREKAGRLIFNGFPTGVEVGHAMHHGGPYPATTDSRFTSVGSAAIVRFAKPICFQNFPSELLPAELQDGNPRGIWRLVDGRMTRE